MAFTHTEGHKYLLSPKTDWLTVGGLSVILLPVFMLIPFSATQTEIFGWTLYAIAFIVNYPHFTVSYQIIYGDYRYLLFKDYRFIWAGFIVPILMFIFIGWWFTNPSPEMLSYFVEFMFIIVGWHYVKQSYGAVMVTSTMKKYFYNKLERYTLKFNMYALWFTSLVSFNVGYKNDYDYWGIKFNSLNFDKNFLYVGYGLTALSLLMLGVILLRRIIKTKQWPPLATFASFFSIYAWYLPVLYNPTYFLAVPFFHSIQYFTFVVALKKNEATDQHMNKSKVLNSVIGFLAIAIFSGAVLFEVFPRILDVGISYDHNLFGEGLFLFLFSVFINIHHYFIDNVIWRKDNEKVQKYLFT